MADFNDVINERNAPYLNQHMGQLEAKASCGAQRKAISLYRAYGIAPSSWWSHPDHRAVKELPGDAFRTYVYLCSSPNSNAIGLYRLTVGAMAADLRIGTEDCEELLDQLQQAALVEYDKSLEWVWVVNLAGDQIRCTSIKPPRDKGAISMKKLYAGIPSGILKKRFRDMYGDLLALDEE